MSISANLGELNYQRNQEWSLPFSQENARPAVYAFSGDVYRGLNAWPLWLTETVGPYTTLSIGDGN